MHPIIEAKRQVGADLCRRSGVNRLEVFGSAARDDFDKARSDIDLLVEFVPRPDTRGLAPYFDLKLALDRIFARKVDLVEAGSVRKPCVCADIERHRQVLYGA